MLIKSSLAGAGRQLVKPALIVVLASIVLMGTMWTGSASSVNDTQALKLRPTNNLVFIGAYEPRSEPGRLDFERVIGRRVAVVSSFQSWSDKKGKRNYFTQGWRDFAQTLNSNNQVLMITWEPWVLSGGVDQPKYRLRTIINGKHDRYMKRWFKQVRDLRQPVFVRFAHEMNGDWYPWGLHVNKPREYVEAWRHVVRLSRKVGADNITWVWAPNAKMPHDHMKKLWPGQKFVDWIGVSGYNWGGPERDWSGWRSARKIFSQTLEIIKDYNKPIMIAETGSRENPLPNPPARQTKAVWLDRTYRYLRNVEPKISLIIYQNERASKTYDWRVTTSRAGKRAIKRVLSKSIFKGMFLN